MRIMNNKNVVIETLAGGSVSERVVEVVERKGLGHPDSICDGVMENAAIALAREYRERTGKILHHNLDKALLVAGSVRKKFGGGQVLTPMLLILGDRATFQFDTQDIPVHDIVEASAKEWFRKHLRFVDSDKHVAFQVEIKPGSVELQEIFEQQRAIVANDTSVGVGHAPLSDTEKLVLETEMHLNSDEFKQNFPETGEDVKILAIRRESNLNLTVAMPFVDHFISDEASYFERKKMIERAVYDFLRQRETKGFKKIELLLNALDKKGRGIEGIYLSVCGTSAEDADSGQVGRGNRVHGLISFSRPCSLEAAAGKNAVSHVGKIYNVFAYQLAREIYQEVNGLKEVYVTLASLIGSPISQPAIVFAQISLEDRNFLSRVEKQIREIIERELAQMDKLCEELLAGRHRIY